MNLVRTLHTLRYLRPIQVGARFYRPAFRLIRPRRALGPHRLRPRNAVPPAARGNRLVTQGGFRFLNQQRAFEGEARWEQPAASRLWVYNLHYFQYLWEMDAAQGLEMIRDWIAANPEQRGPGWEPYPTSLRVREWMEWLHDHQDAPAEARDAIVASLVRQVHGLEGQLEHHLLGNHLLENAIALCWSGLSLEGDESARWLSRGLALMERELAEQVLDDGVHDERSPMYQALICEALLRLAEVAQCSLQHALSAQTAATAGTAGCSMLAALEYLVHPDGDYALLNDSALGIAPSYRQLEKRFPWAVERASGRRIGTSGYASHHGPDTYLVFDGGPIGPDHQPGHGHADTLSFELSRGGQRLITDTGVYTYDRGATRSLDCGTAAHNTIEVDGQDQSELWAAFRCGRRAAARPLRSQFERGGQTASGGYSGPRGVYHDRTLSLAQDELLVTDNVRCKGRHIARSRLHFAPGLDVDCTAGVWVIRDGTHRRAILDSPHVDWSLSSTPYHPEFGIEIGRVCLTATMPFSDKLDTAWTLRFC